jgi:hypothetical protein
MLPFPMFTPFTLNREESHGGFRPRPTVPCPSPRPKSLLVPSSSDLSARRLPRSRRGVSALGSLPSPSFRNLQTFQLSNLPTFPRAIPFTIRSSAKRVRNSCRMRSFKTQDLKGNYVLDTD